MSSFDELIGFLAQSLEDGKISRGEKKALTELLKEQPLSKKQRRTFLSKASNLATERLRRQQDRDVVEWVADVAKIVAAQKPTTEQKPVSEVLFAPDDPVAERIGKCIETAEQSIQICVFTITDNQLTRQLLAAHKRGVAVRIVSDDDKSLDQGSDIRRLIQEGVSVRTDKDPNHMHHKFAILDQKILLTGSYNWTFSASRHNRENLLISDDQDLVAPYLDEFEKLWQLYAPA